MDKLLLILTFTLIAIGIVTVFDASYAPALQAGQSPFGMLIKQARWALLGLGCLLLATMVPYWYWRRWTIPAISLAVILLTATLIPHIGHGSHGARRWIGPSALHLQPSEFAKLALILYLAHWCTVARGKIRKLKEGLSRPLVIMGLLALLIAKEPDLGTTIVLCGTGLMLLYMAGARRRHLGSVVVIAAVVAVMHSLSKQYSLNRWIAYMNPAAHQLDEGYQVWHGLLALGSAGIPGLGLGDGIEKLNVPMAHTDFIFAVIGEEWGLIGTLTLLGLFLLVAARGYTIAHNTRDPFGAMLAAGLTSLISLQAIINIAVVTSSIPDTGVPLPFISYGGSALLLMMTSMGLLLNISRHPNGRPKTPEEDATPTPAEEDFYRRWDRHPYVPKYDRTWPSDSPSRASGRDAGSSHAESGRRDAGSSREENGRRDSPSRAWTGHSEPRPLTRTDRRTPVGTGRGPERPERRW
jgi:cell division protein FtsW